MKKYEYMECIIFKFAEALEKLGAEGWEHYDTKGHKEVFRREVK